MDCAEHRVALLQYLTGVEEHVRAFFYFALVAGAGAVDRGQEYRAAERLAQGPRDRSRIRRARFEAEPAGREDLQGWRCQCSCRELGMGQSS